MAVAHKVREKIDRADEEGYPNAALFYVSRVEVEILAAQVLRDHDRTYLSLVDAEA